MACVKAMRLGSVGNPRETCVGDRFALLIDPTGEQRYFLVYATVAANGASAALAACERGGHPRRSADEARRR